ncbi:MAG: hypothetical protein K2N68_04315 [Clostridia bacterium]|nr:hypothetical protein [Clostridia bacterium]
MGGAPQRSVVHNFPLTPKKIFFIFKTPHIGGFSVIWGNKKPLLLRVGDKTFNICKIGKVKRLPKKANRKFAENVRNFS